MLAQSSEVDTPSPTAPHGLRDGIPDVWGKDWSSGKALGTLSLPGIPLPPGNVGTSYRAPPGGHLYVVPLFPNLEGDDVAFVQAVDFQPATCVGGLCRRCLGVDAHPVPWRLDLQDF